MKRSINDREKTKMPVKTTSNQDDDYQLSDSDKKITTTRFYSLRGGVVKRSQEPEVIHLEDSEEEENQTSTQMSSSSSKKRRSSPENQNRQALNTSKAKKEEENKTVGNISTISAEATCSQKSTSSEHNKNNTSISKSSAETPSKQPNQDNIEPTSDESTCQANQVVKTKSKSNSIVCEKLNIKKRHLEKCALKMLNLISLEGSLELNCKYIQIGGFRNTDPFTIKFHDNGEIELDVNDDEGTISVILGDVDINFAAGFFFDPLFGIVFAIEESTAKMYINKLKELSSYDNSIKPDHKSNSELILVFQITHEEENIIAQKLYLYFKKSCDLRRERQKTESSKKIDFNFGFLKESRAREVLYEAFLNREKPSEIEKFIGSYTPISPEQCIKYPLNSDSSLTITVEDLKCLKDGEFLNDNIISFYLKYIYHDLISDRDRKRTHIFDTFFYQRLTDGTRRKGEGFSNSPSKRHAKVKNWTRNVNIFEKDFLIVPINKRAHWFMAIICYPYLLEPVTEEDSNTNDEEPSQSSSSQKSDKTTTRSASKKKWLDEFSQYISSDANKALSTTSEATNETIIDDDDENNSDYEKRVIKKMSVYKNCVKMPIILIFDSLSTSKCHMVMNNLREYLIAEWKTRHPNDSEEEVDKYVKAFKELCGYCVRVPQQKNFYDCGIFMLQYVESFFQNPITKYDLPIRLDNWFDEEVTDSKREKIRRIIEDVAQKQKESKQEKQSKKD